jgi:hypothetical protein
VTIRTADIVLETNEKFLARNTQIETLHLKKKNIYIKTMA